LNGNSLPSQFGLVMTTAIVAPATSRRRPLKQPAQKAFRGPRRLAFFLGSAVGARADREADGQRARSPRVRSLDTAGDQCPPYKAALRTWGKRSACDRQICHESQGEVAPGTTRDRVDRGFTWAAIPAWASGSVRRFVDGRVTPLTVSVLSEHVSRPYEVSAKVWKPPAAICVTGPVAPAATPAWASGPVRNRRYDTRCCQSACVASGSPPSGGGFALLFHHGRLLRRGQRPRSMHAGVQRRPEDHLTDRAERVGGEAADLTLAKT
jgi:hypothetical protein